MGEVSILWKEGALLTGNAFHEHCLEVYLAWMLSSEDPDACQFYYAMDDATLEHVMLLPCDRNYEVLFLSEKDQELNLMAAWFPSFQQKDVFFRRISAQASAGGAVRILGTEEIRAVLSGADEDEKTALSPGEEADLLQFNEGKGLGDRVLTWALILLIVVLVLLILLLWLIVHLIRKRRKRKARKASPTDASAA